MFYSVFCTRALSRYAAGGRCRQNRQGATLVGPACELWRALLRRQRVPHPKAGALVPPALKKLLLVCLVAPACSRHAGVQCPAG